jgi:hypothetical protein
MLLVLGVINVFAQNETSKTFLDGTVLVRQAGSSLDKFPKLEIGFVGRRLEDTGEPRAFLFMRFQSTMETGGGIISEWYDRDQKKGEGNALRNFAVIMATADVAATRAQNSGAILDLELGEVELSDFQWYMIENQWKWTRDKLVRIRIKMQTVGNEHRLYFYRTSSVKDYRNEFETFTMPNDVYLTSEQCRQLAYAYGDENSILWKAVEIAQESVAKTVR